VIAHFDVRGLGSVAPASESRVRAAN
jgi:hypothetical protein